MHRAEDPLAAGGNVRFGRLTLPALGDFHDVAKLAGRAYGIEPRIAAEECGRVESTLHGTAERFERAGVLGASRVASGHYARVDRDPATGLRRLRRAADPDKDQTYFLFQLDQAQLEALELPLGPLRKSEVREKARALGLATAEKAESQEICFVPDGDYAKVVEALRPGAKAGEGEIVDGSGRVLGRHAGVHRFTVGQRRGLGLASAERLYVRSLDAATSRVVVGSEAELAVPGARLEGVSWIGGAPAAPVRAQVHIRYRHAGAAATLTPQGDGRVHVAFDAPQRAVTPGQAAVFYDGEVCLGGGWIEA